MVKPARTFVLLITHYADALKIFIFYSHCQIPLSPYSQSLGEELLESFFLLFTNLW